MSVRSHSKWNRTFTWMLSVALIAQGGIAVYAGDFGSEASVEAISEEAAQQVGTEEDFGSNLEFSGDEETTAGEENTETGTDAADFEISEGDGQVEDDSVSGGEEDFSSEFRIEQEDTLVDGIYLGNAVADTSVGQIIDGNIVFHGVSEDTSLFVPVYGERGGNKIAVRDMTWESSDETVVSIFDTDSDDQLQLRSHKAGGTVITGTYQPTDENGAASGDPMTISIRVFVKGIVLDAGSESIQLSLNEDLSAQAIGYRLIDGTGETGVAADGQDITWSVDDPQIVQVDTDGNLTAKAPGEAEVTLTWGEFTATSKVSVTGMGVKLTPASQSIKQTGATIIFAEAWDGTEKVEDPVLTWISSDPSVATVDEKGIVSGIGTGTTDITAVWNGVQSESLQIRVTAATDVSVTTRWEDSGALTYRPARVNISLLSNGFDYNSISLGTDTEWRHVWVLLDSQDDNGTPITYDISPEVPIGYTAEIQGNASEGFTVVYRQK